MLYAKVRNITLGNSGITGGGGTSATLEIYSTSDLNPAAAGTSIGTIDRGVSLNGISIQLDQVIAIGYNMLAIGSHITRNFTCVGATVNYPSSLQIENPHYNTLSANQGVQFPDGLSVPDLRLYGFVGYVSRISAHTKDMQSYIEVELSDERWKWNQYKLPQVLINNIQKPGVYAGGAARAASRFEYNSSELLDFVTSILGEYGHRSSYQFSFSKGSLPTRMVGNLQVGNSAYDFVSRLMLEYFGGEYQLFSKGAGHLQIVKVKTDYYVSGGDYGTIGTSVDTTNMLSNDLTFVRSSEEDIDMAIGIGANRQYYVGDGTIDNELVPDWDWYNDGKILIIDKKTLTPAMYFDQNGIPRLVNPFYFAVQINTPTDYQFVDPNLGGTLVFDVRGESDLMSSYPSFKKYLQYFEIPVAFTDTPVDISYTQKREILKYCYATTYAMDCIYRPHAFKEPIHNGRFRRYRLKDKLYRQYIDWQGNPQAYTDQQIFPVKYGKDFPADPAGLNDKVLEGIWDVHDPIIYNRYTINNYQGYDGYKVIIQDQFINNAIYDVVLYSQKNPNQSTLGPITSQDQVDTYFQPVPDDDPRFFKKGPSFGAICVKYDIVQTSQNVGGSTVRAERVKIDGFSVTNGNKIVFNEPQYITTNTIDAALFYDTNVTLTQPTPESILFLDDTLRDTTGTPITSDGGPLASDGSNKLKWYYLLHAGGTVSPVDRIRNASYPFRKRMPYPTDGEQFIYQQVPYAIGYPRIEMFGFVQYEDMPEKEGTNLLSQFDTAYWSTIKSAFFYPNHESIYRNRTNIYYSNDWVAQTGGLYEYTGEINSDVNKREVVSFYDSGTLAIAEDFNEGTYSLTSVGFKKVIIAFQLRNDTQKFEEYAKNRTPLVVPKGVADYYERPDLMPENNGTHLMISTVTHDFSNGWLTRISYGGPLPERKELVTRYNRFQAAVAYQFDSVDNKDSLQIATPLSQSRRTA